MSKRICMFPLVFLFLTTILIVSSSTVFAADFGTVIDSTEDL